MKHFPIAFEQSSRHPSIFLPSVYHWKTKHIGSADTPTGQDFSLSPIHDAHKSKVHRVLSFFRPWPEFPSKISVVSVTVLEDPFSSVYPSQTLCNPAFHSWKVWAFTSQILQKNASNGYYFAISRSIGLVTGILLSFISSSSSTIVFSSFS